MDKRVFCIEPRATHLYIPPITWKGDPGGHIGINDVFFFVLEGECYLNIDEQCFILKEGDLAFLPKGLKRTYTAVSPNFKMYAMSFEATVNGINLFEYFKLRDSDYQVRVKDKNFIARCFENSIEHKHRPDEILYVRKVQNIMSVINEYITLRQEEKLMEKPFEEVILYMRANTNQKINVDKLASIACMQTNYFIRKFTKAMGISPMQYHARLKCYRAMSLIANSDITPDKASQMIGIDDYAYFCRFFKKHCGMSPMAYKRLLK